MLFDSPPKTRKPIPPWVIILLRVARFIGMTVAAALIVLTILATCASDVVLPR